MPPINLSDVFPQPLCEFAANAHVGKNETSDLKQAGADFCIMYPYEQRGNTPLHIFVMPNIIHVDGRLINGCISRVGHMKWVYSAPTGTQTHALRCSNRKKRTRKTNYSTFDLQRHVLEIVQKLRIGNVCSITIMLNKTCFVCDPAEDV